MRPWKNSAIFAKIRFALLLAVIFPLNAYSADELTPMQKLARLSPKAFSLITCGSTAVGMKMALPSKIFLKAIPRVAILASLGIGAVTCADGVIAMSESYTEDSNSDLAAVLRSPLSAKPIGPLLSATTDSEIPSRSAARLRGN